MPIIPNNESPITTPIIVTRGCVLATFFPTAILMKLSTVDTIRYPYIIIPIPSQLFPFEISISPAGMKTKGDPKSEIIDKKAAIAPQNSGLLIPKIQNPIPNNVPCISAIKL